jgi:4-hydroxybenzoate polyprenyltransferase
MYHALVDYLRMIKFSHSVFALPFAFTSAILAARGLPEWREVLWIAVAMVGARSGAMGLNRYIDRLIDACNPRTAGRELPAGKISPAAALTFSVASLGLMVLAAWQLNPLCLQLSPLAIAVLVLYSYTKRFTWAAHFVLGLAIAAAPLGAWIAVTGEVSREAWPLTLAVLFWLPGFDILYALQDREFDLAEGLRSIPARFGVRNSLYLARVLHAASCAMLAWAGVLFHLGLIYWLGFICVSGLFVYEHALVKPGDLSRLDMAFFNMNGYISLTVFIMTALDLFASV